MLLTGGNLIAIFVGFLVCNVVVTSILCVVMTRLLGYNHGKAKKPQKKPADEQARAKAERIHQEFELISGYNLNTALKRKVSK